MKIDWTRPLQAVGGFPVRYLGALRRESPHVHAVAIEYGAGRYEHIALFDDHGLSPGNGSIQNKPIGCVWINLYSNGTTGWVWETEQKARAAAEKDESGGSRQLIETRKIEW